ncbi:vWA domain-containing protein [Gandjariella thermophila]|uniref:VWA domain-containing protein n=1 Tax=Gandjariella thermophila TaxID=1931992 RepID=A0A4D4J4M4_9PSEU|nr:VWA domain-containing protein [Gandjariella thermophila]GDY29579.1 VWA domain-containing protein [Gandjariella thermophila]
MTGLPDRLVEFVTALREHGVPVGPSETVDAAAALRVVGLADRDQLRESLAATLLRRSGERAVFDGVFELYFPAAVGVRQTALDPPPGDDLDAWRDLLVAALAEGRDERLRALAASGVDMLGRFGSGAGGGPMAGWSAYQTLDRLRPESLLARVLAAMRDRAGTEDPLAEEVDRGEAARRVARFRDLVQQEARRRTAELRGRERVSRYGVAPSTDLVGFTTAGRAQLAEMRRTIQPLARKLATRLAARRRRARRGQIDLRRTMRRSLATSGVPVRPAFRRRRQGRPDLVLLCDMSGSVAGFAQFTLLLVQALRDQFSRVRVFAFVGVTDEITHLVEAGEDDPEGLASRIFREATLTWWGTNSDYGNALATFAERWLDAVGPRTSVLILGDGRTNGGDPNLRALRRIADRARHVYWLNPEAEPLWHTGDSAARAYAEVVTMYECRNIRQLSQVITRLLPA